MISFLESKLCTFSVELSDINSDVNLISKSIKDIELNSSATQSEQNKKSADCSENEVNSDIAMQTLIELFNRLISIVSRKVNIILNFSIDSVHVNSDFLQKFHFIFFHYFLLMPLSNLFN